MWWQSSPRKVAWPAARGPLGRLAARPLGRWARAAWPRWRISPQRGLPRASKFWAPLCFHGERCVCLAHLFNTNGVAFRNRLFLCKRALESLDKSLRSPVAFFSPRELWVSLACLMFPFIFHPSDKPTGEVHLVSAQHHSTQSLHVYLLLREHGNGLNAGWRIKDSLTWFSKHFPGCPWKTRLLVGT